MLLPGVKVHTEFERLGHSYINIRTDIELFVFGRALLINSILILAIELDKIGNSLRATAYAHSIFMLH